MAFTNFIPAVWSARLLEHLDKAHVYGALVNRDYEGEIKEFGDTVHINRIGAVTIKSYTKNTDIDAPEALSNEDQTLVINQAKYFNFQIDDIDKAQIRPELMNSATQRAAYALADVSDQYIAGLMAAGAAGTVGSDASPITVTSTNAYEQLVALKVKLDEQNVPTIGRWVVVPAWFHGLLLMDNRFVANGTDKGVNALQNGLVGYAAGFEIHMSNNVPNTENAKYKIVGGTNLGCAFAEQIVELQPYTPEKRFADALKGLNVYGAKVVEGNALACLTANHE